MNKRELWQDVVKKYPEHWIGFKDPEYNDDNTLRSVIVIYVSKNRSEITHHQLTEPGLHGQFTTPEKAPDYMHVGIVS